MNTKNTTPPHFLDRFSYKVLFYVKGNEQLIHKLSSQNILVRVDPTQEMACACFDNSKDSIRLRAKVG